MSESLPAFTPVLPVFIGKLTGGKLVVGAAVGIAGTKPPSPLKMATIPSRKPARGSTALALIDLGSRDSGKTTQRGDNGAEYVSITRKTDLERRTDDNQIESVAI
ncbi:hypothetical protein TWF970_002823 [Orbilia oligospora]|uniref:Uncharacterized protein n=1 Tax=Orbilia oligospora TaxID=2813651 RepID=A0A7C8VII3_ORBOL|nr:hypothetical protein TWF970_002823 [Orbilia oligospora]